jgi:hypothetical protein
MKLPVSRPKELENPSPPAFYAAGFFVLGDEHGEE